jgi:outer membrane protein insertion porin family
MASVFIF